MTTSSRARWSGRAFPEIERYCVCVGADVITSLSAYCGPPRAGLVLDIIAGVMIGYSALTHLLTHEGKRYLRKRTEVTLAQKIYRGSFRPWGGATRVSSSQEPRIRAAR
jgi:hypothetical protein